MKTKPVYKVTFRNSVDKLTSMFEETYRSEREAKEAIEFDAGFFLNGHKYCGGPTGMKFRQKSHWVNSKTEDYYEAQGQDGARCVWQYFKI